MLHDRIAAETRFPAKLITRVAQTANHLYKTYAIPKKNGGLRIIDHPAKDLKLLQRWLVQNVLSQLPVHGSAMAYRRNSGVGENARVHAPFSYMLRVDFENFFPSITADDIRSLLRLNRGTLDRIGISSDDFELIVRLACKDGRLTIGAPSSPALSNAVMFTFDNEWYETAHAMDVAYTRYADDIYFSTHRPRLLIALLEQLRGDLARRPSPRLRINEAKTVFTSRKRRRLVTGLVLTSDNKVSLGRTTKRRIRTLVFRSGLGDLSREQTMYLRGYISYARSVDPQFVASLQRRYGEQLERLRTLDARSDGNLPAH